MDNSRGGEWMNHDVNTSSKRQEQQRECNPLGNVVILPKVSELL